MAAPIERFIGMSFLITALHARFRRPISFFCDDRVQSMLLLRCLYTISLRLRAYSHHQKHFVPVNAKFLADWGATVIYLEARVAYPEALCEGGAR
jgi:hypothetical protein